MPKKERKALLHAAHDIESKTMLWLTSYPGKKGQSSRGAWRAARHRAEYVPSEEVNLKFFHVGVRWLARGAGSFVLGGWVGGWWWGPPKSLGRFRSIVCSLGKKFVSEFGFWFGKKNIRVGRVCGRVCFFPVRVLETRGRTQLRYTVNIEVSAWSHSDEEGGLGCFGAAWKETNSEC